MVDGSSDESSIASLITRLADDARAYAHAEIAYYRTLAAGKAVEARNSLILGAVALLLVLGAAIALLMGLVLTLATLVGPGWATLIVVAVALAIAGLLGWLAYVRLRRLFSVEPETMEPEEEP